MIENSAGQLLSENDTVHSYFSINLLTSLYKLTVISVLFIISK